MLTIYYYFFFWGGGGIEAQTISNCETSVPIHQAQLVAHSTWSLDYIIMHTHNLPAVLKANIHNSNSCLVKRVILKSSLTIHRCLAIYMVGSINKCTTMLTVRPQFELQGC